MTDEGLDVVVIGGGPAGSAAAIACARAGARVVLLEPLSVGGELMNIPEVEELPESEQASGPDLVAALTERVLSSGVDLRLGDGAESLEPCDLGWRLQTYSGVLTASAVVLATGAGPRGLPDAPDATEDELHDMGLSTCASCDAPLYAGRRVAVVGGGDTGAGAALLLSGHAREVVLLEREAELTCQELLRRRLAGAPNLELRLGFEVLGLADEGGVRATAANGDLVEPADGVLLAVGMRPRSGLVAPHLELDDSGAVRVDAALASSAPGLFAAGDVRKDAGWRCGAAWGDGLTAARSAMRTLSATPR